MTKTSQIAIVDASDNLIEYKTKDSFDPIHDIYRVAALWLVDTDGKILLAQRSFLHTNGPGQWGPAAAGTVEAESYQENILKEANEEIGLKDIELIEGPKLFVDGNRRYFCQWYIGVIKPCDTSAFVLEADEVASVKWVTADELAHDVRTRPERYVPGFEGTVRELIGYRR